MSVDRSWLRDQVAAFKEVRRLYQDYALLLEGALLRGAKESGVVAIVQQRAKEVRSFAGKAVRLAKRVPDPVHGLTDLCGARAIVQILPDVEVIARFVREHFIIDEANSQDVAERLGAHEFGYRSVHFIVQIDPARLPEGLAAKAGVNSASVEEIAASGLKAEIQLRTMAQHVWADVGHDRLYKSTFQVPRDFERQSAKIAALLEEVDAAFAQLVAGVDTLRTNLGTYADKASTIDRIGQLQAILQFDDRNADLAAELCRRHISIGEYDAAIRVVLGFQGDKTADLLTCHGHALCQNHRANKRSEEYLKGQEFLGSAAAKDPANIEAATLLAESWVGVDERKALDQFRRAFEINNSDPRALAGFLRHQIAYDRNIKSIDLLRPTIEAAIDKTQSQIDVRVNLPQALYQQAQFLLLVGRTFEGLNVLARAICLTSDLSGADLSQLDHAIDACQLLQEVASLPEGIKWADLMLRLARQAHRAPGSFDPHLVPTAGEAKLKGPILILAGGCERSVEKHVEGYRGLLEGAIAAFEGTLISGGTEQGISGLAAALATAHGRRITLVGYVPEHLPTDGSASVDRRYQVHRTKGGSGFTPLEPIQSWIDVLHSGIEPADVTLIGINGGEIAAFEYHLAAALGANVAVVRDSGRKADVLMLEEGIPGNERIHFVPADVECLRAVMTYPPTSDFTPEELLQLASGAQEEYNAQVERNQRADKLEWLSKHPDLKRNFERSNLMQVTQIPEKLARIGKKLVKVEGGNAKPAPFTENQVELQAAVEHGRWVVERTWDGWKLGARDDQKRTREQLIPWDKLKESDKEKDRAAVRAIPRLLAKLGYEIVDA